MAIGISDDLLSGQGPLEIVTVGDPRLVRKAELVTDDTWGAAVKLAKRMLETLKTAGAQGLAAPQVGCNLRVIVFQTHPTHTRPDAPMSPQYVMFNPDITDFSPATNDDWEGCFSCFPGELFGNVRRHDWVSVRYWDLSRTERSDTLHGFLARVMQHEVDHLDGLSYLDRALYGRRAVEVLATKDHYNP